MIVFDTEKKKVKNLVVIDSSDINGGGGGGESSTPVMLLSVTTAPTGTFSIGSKYYNATDKLIYTATEDNVWGTEGETPKFYTIYQCNDTYYQWDGDNLVETDLEKYATKEELNAKQDALVSGENIKTINGNSVLGEGNIAVKTYQPFGSSWPTSTSFSAFLSAINSDTSAVEGMAYLGDLSCSGLPTGIHNAEAVVEIINSTTNSKCIHVIITSGNVAPYRWEYTYWNNGSNVSGWIAFQQQLNSANVLTTGSGNVIDGISASGGTITATKNTTLATVATTGSYNDLINKPDFANIYDTKVLPEPLVEAGWAPICKDARQDLAKATIPTVYADLLEKYQNVDTESTGVTAKTSSYNPAFYMNGYYYYATRTGNSSTSRNFQIYRSANIDLSDAELVYETGTISGGNIMPILLKGEDVIIFIHGNNVSGWVPEFKMFDLDFNLLHSYTQTGDIANLMSQEYRGYFKFYKNKLYFWSKQSPCCYDYVNNVLTNFGTFGNNERMYSDLIIIDDYLYFTKGYNTLNRINVNTGVAESVSLSGMNTEASAFFVYNGELKLLDRNYVLTIDTENFTVTSVATSTFLPNISLGPVAFVKKIGDTYYFWINKKIYTTTDWQNFSLLMENVELFTSNIGQYTTYGYYYSHMGFYITDDQSTILLSEYNGPDSIWGSSNGYYYYSGTVKKEYTDDYTIDGNTVTIKYFKSGDWKICVPNTTNDTALASLYSGLGYSPYWRIDVSSETLSLPRNSNKFSYMYVGDNYEDSTLPTGNWERSALISEIEAKQDKITSSNKLSASLVSGLATVATSGSYNDLSGTPTIPTVNDAVLTIQQNGLTISTFSANAMTNTTMNVTVPTATSDLTNDSNFITDKSVVSISDATASFAVQANTYYVCSGELTSLTITSITSSTLETLIVFTAGSGFTFTLPANTEYCGTMPTTWTQGDKYIVSVLLGIVTLTKVNRV